MAWSQGSGDYLLRRFLGDHFDGPLDEVLSPGRQQEQEIPNPNLEDLPPEPRGSGVTRVQEGNVFWSERANTEHVLRQMRPEHLPPLDASVSIQGSERGRASHSLSDPPFGAEEWLQTAREMDRQTSIGHLPEPQAIQFLRDSAGIGQREPEYFFMAAADTPEERSLHRQDDGSEMMNRDTALWADCQAGGLVNLLSAGPLSSVLLNQVLARVPRWVGGLVSLSSVSARRSTLHS